MLELVEGIKQNTSLKVLHILKNQMSDKGAKYVAQALADQRYLTEVDLSGNQIKANGIDILINMMKDNLNIETFGIHGIQVSESQKEKLKSYTRLNKGGRKLLQQTNVPLKSWVETLAKVSDDTDLCFNLFHEKPDMFNAIVR